jgi:anaerobic ribonucleoside-triphosphate reductase activating protein
MQIKRICYPIRVLGPGERVGIWVCGCNFKCPGCMSPELQSFSAGNSISVENIVCVLEKLPHKIEGITISGGEPFEQAEELARLVKVLSEKFTDDIIIYTGYTLEELEKKQHCKDVLKHIAVLVDGRYVDGLNTGKGLAGSENQKIIAFRNPQRYAYMKDCNRELQMLNYGDTSSLVVGLL